MVGVGADAGITNVVGAIVAVVRTGRAVCHVRMGARTGPVADIIRTLVAIIRAGGPRRLVVWQAGSRSVTSVGVGAVVVGGVTAGGAGRKVRMRTGSRRADVVRTVIAVVGAARIVG